MNGEFSEEALEAYSKLAAESKGLEFAEGETYDFTRCVRADGTAYGTRGKCRQGSEEAKAPEAPKAAQGGSGAKSGAEKKPKFDDRGKRERAAAVREIIQKEGKPAQVAAKQADARAKDLRGEATRAGRAYNEAEKALKKNPSKEARERVKEARSQAIQADRVAARAEREADKKQAVFERAMKKARRAGMTAGQKKDEREWNKYKKIWG